MRFKTLQPLYPDSGCVKLLGHKQSTMSGRIRSHPLGELFFRDRPIGDTEHIHTDLSLFRGELPPVVAEENVSRQESRSLVAIDERVVLYDTEGVGRR